MLVFDGDCAVCTSTARFARRRLPADVRVVPWQWIEDPAAWDLTHEAIAEAAWWIDDARRPHRGHRALAECAKAFGGAWRVFGRLLLAWPLEPLSARAYEVVAGNRHRLPGATPACAIPRSDPDRASRP
jgi:predicted DCC family thiol-disulfide oxidoreductase YuxK